ncbi:MAG: tetratricopeptide repeat protein [Planctomycetales bacterium]|nr:tetratricopeptide repeat protein [Planctomycetales bacterium]
MSRNLTSPTTPTGCYAPGRFARFGWVVLVSALAGCAASAHNHNAAGVRNLQLGRYHDAIQSFQQALVSDPNNPDAYYNLAATYYDMGKRNQDTNLLAQAEGLYHQCLDLDANHVDCYRGLAALLVDTNRSESAFTLLKGWANRSPQLAESRIELARLYEEFGDQDSAIRHLTDALNLDASNSRAWTAMGRLREKRGELAQALSNYQQAYNLNQFQPGIADRIASLQQTIATGRLNGTTGTAAR